jgi:predicted DNA-binding protein
MVSQTLHLPTETAERVKALANAQHVTESRVLVELIESDLETRHYSELVDRLASTTDPIQRIQLKEELARLTFGQ